MKYFHRDTEKRIGRALEQFPVILITGPRQAGKSTLLQKCLKGYTYLTLDDPTIRALAQEDPELFLSSYKHPLIIDEIQYAPNLLPYIKMRVDQKRDTYGQYVLTGSQSFQLMEGVSETLAGRIAIFHLYPFNWNEIKDVQSPMDERKLLECMVQGFYPEFFSNPRVDWDLWCGSYIATYLERDLRNIKAVTDLRKFQTFLRLLAARAGSLLNISEVAKECGITQPTAKAWISILESTYIVYLLKPYHTNHTKRLVKRPKLYFIDTGLLCYFLGVDTPERLLTSPYRGSIFENMVIVDRLKTSAYAEHHEDLFFYRTQKGAEIDLIIESRGELTAYEIKFTKSPSKTMVSTLRSFGADHPNAKLCLLCLRHTPLPLTDRIHTQHWASKEA